MKFAAIESALHERFLSGGFLPATQVQTDNETFTPPASKPWARLTNLPAQPDVVTLGEGGQDLHVGLLQVDLFFPQGKGRAAVLALADRIAGHFKAGEKWLYDGQAVRVTSCGIGNGINDGGWYRRTVTINWKAHVTR